MDIKTIIKRLRSYRNVSIQLDLKSISDKQKEIIESLVAAGTVADEIFWHQSSQDAINIREQYKDRPGPEKDYIEINYGPYDRLFDFRRFIGNGALQKPAGAGFYPEDLSKKEFLNYVRKHPEKREGFEDPYTIIQRTPDGLEAKYYHQVYKSDIHRMTAYMLKAAEMTTNLSLRSYLLERAQALHTDQYYQSDLNWMNLKDNLIDTVIGPIENYEDRLFNYKSAYEAAVMVKDITTSEELAVYKKHLNHLEKILPIDDKFKKVNMGARNILEIVNIAYFGGDFQAGVKTIAASLPNDEKIIRTRGAKKQLYKNIIEAKFDKILIPIANLLIAKQQKSLVSKEKFISQVLLHEISHTVGPNYVKNSTKPVRKALQEKYSIIEECKADVLAIYFVPYFSEVFSLTQSDIRKHYITYVSNLFRSIRFGVDEAHGLANLIQLNVLKKGEVLRRQKHSGTYSVAFNLLHKSITKLASQLLMIEIHGDYDGALKLIADYGYMTSEIEDTIEKLNNIPRDLNLSFQLNF